MPDERYIPPGQTPESTLAAQVARLQRELDDLRGTALARAGAVSPPTAESATVATFETTTSASYTDLASVGPSVTVDVGESGAVLVILTAYLANSIVDGAAYMGFSIAGAAVVAARVLNHISHTAGQPAQMSAIYKVTGITPGSRTFVAKYRRDSAGGTMTAGNRNLIVIPVA